MSKWLVLLGAVLALGALVHVWTPAGVSHRRPSMATSGAEHPAGEAAFADGDLIFQTSRSGQSLAIQRATGSVYSHCGLIYREQGGMVVLEAVQPVKTTPLAEWIARGEGGQYVVKRLKDADRVLTPAALGRMKAEGRRFLGKDYDLAFGWSDEKIYCSELIWKVYQRATGVEVGELERLGDFDLTDAAVKAKMKERYGPGIPLDETVISPAAIFRSGRLTTVWSE